jgi:hypothetical protein
MTMTRQRRWPLPRRARRALLGLNDELPAPEDAMARPAALLDEAEAFIRAFCAENPAAGAGACPRTCPPWRTHRSWAWRDPSVVVSAKDLAGGPCSNCGPVWMLALLMRMFTSDAIAAAFSMCSWFVTSRSSG